MTIKKLIEKLQQIKNKDQEIFISIDNNDGLDIINVEEDTFASFINVHDDEENF